MNITQEFLYETDEPPAIQRMLEAIVANMFEGGNGKYTQLHLWSAPRDFSFDNDSYKDHNLRQSIVEVAGKFHILGRRRSPWNSHFLESGPCFDTEQAAIAETSKRFDALSTPLPKRLWLATASNLKSNVGAKDTVCKSQKELIAEIMSRIQLALKNRKEEFFDVCGDGYNDWFNSDDGSIDAGIRLHRSPQGGWDLLHISMVHIYYGK